MYINMRLYLFISLQNIHTLKTHVKIHALKTHVTNNILFIYRMPHGIVKRKINVSNIFNCSDLNDFIASIVYILPFRGISMSKFYICECDGVRFLTKVGFYYKTPREIYGTPNELVMSHIDAEVNILNVFKRVFIDKNVTPCILELVHEKICSVGKLVPKEKICEHLMLNYRNNAPEDDIEQTMCKYNDLVRNGLAHNKCAFLVLEKCDITLEEYLRKSINTPVSLAVFKSLLFMIVYTFYAINAVYPRFRHYDLHTENIMLKFDPNYKFKTTNPKFLVFHVDGVQYSVPYFGIIPKVIDFGFSALPEEKIISNVTEDRVQMHYRANNDLLFLFHHIYHTLDHTGVDKLGRVDRMISQLEPNRTYVQYYTEYIRKVEDKIPSYESMVKNSLWEEYKKYKVPSAQIYNDFTPIEEIIK